MDIKYEKSFAKDLKNIRDKTLLRRVKSVIGEFKKAENILEINNIRKLKGYDSFYRIKFGDYRVGIEIIGDEIIFTRFLHRKDIYKFFP